MTWWMQVLLVVLALGVGFLMGRGWELMESIRLEQKDALELRRGERLP